MELVKLIGVLDIGSNSTMLTIASTNLVKPEIITEFCAVTRLGENSNNFSILHSDAIIRTENAILKFVNQARKMGVSNFVGTATSAVRDAANGASFIANLTKKIGFEPQILSGEAEAEAVFLGSTADLPLTSNFITVDPGGGSTEINIGKVGEKPFFGASYNAGCVRLADEFNLYEFPNEERILAARKHLKQLFKPAFDAIDSSDYQLLITAGTATTFSAINHNLQVYDRLKVHHQVSTNNQLEFWINKLFSMSIAERSSLPCIGERALTLPAGLLIMSEIMQGFKMEKFITGTNALRYGMLLKAIKIL